MTLETSPVFDDLSVLSSGSFLMGFHSGAGGLGVTSRLFPSASAIPATVLRNFVQREAGEGPREEEGGLWSPFVLGRPVLGRGPSSPQWRCVPAQGVGVEGQIKLCPNPGLPSFWLCIAASLNFGDPMGSVCPLLLGPQIPTSNLVPWLRRNQKALGLNPSSTIYLLAILCRFLHP